MGFSRQEYWSGLPLPSPGNLPNPGIEPESPALQADSLPSEPPGKQRRVRIAHEGKRKIAARTLNPRREETGATAVPGARAHGKGDFR